MCELTNLIKMVAYQAESDLVRLVALHYKRVEDEGRTLIQSALAGPEYLVVTDSELHVILAPLSSPHRTRALAALSEDLDRGATHFPGSRLRLRMSGDLESGAGFAYRLSTAGFQRARGAFQMISLRFLADSFSARALPPALRATELSGLPDRRAGPRLIALVGLTGAGAGGGR